MWPAGSRRLRRGDPHLSKSGSGFSRDNHTITTQDIQEGCIPPGSDGTPKRGMAGLLVSKEVAFSSGVILDTKSWRRCSMGSDALQ